MCACLSIHFRYGLRVRAVEQRYQSDIARGWIDCFIKLNRDVVIAQIHSSSIIPLDNSSVVILDDYTTIEIALDRDEVNELKALPGFEALNSHLHRRGWWYGA